MQRERDREGGGERDRERGGRDVKRTNRETRNLRWRREQTREAEQSVREVVKRGEQLAPVMGEVEARKGRPVHLK